VHGLLPIDDTITCNSHQLDATQSICNMMLDIQNILLANLQQGFMWCTCVKHNWHSTDVCMWPACQHSMAMGNARNTGRPGHQDHALPRHQAAQLHACPCWPHRSTSLSPASSMSCMSAHGQVCHPALCKSRARRCNCLESCDRPLESTNEPSLQEH